MGNGEWGMEAVGFVTPSRLTLLSSRFGARGVAVNWCTNWWTTEKAGGAKAKEDHDE